MSSPGRWVDVTAPDDAIVAATVRERVYTIHVVPAERSASDFLVDADAGTITLPINAPLFSLVQAVHTARQHEPSVRTQPAPSQRPDLLRAANRQADGGREGRGRRGAGVGRCRPGRRGRTGGARKQVEAELAWTRKQNPYTSELVRLEEGQLGRLRNRLFIGAGTSAVDEEGHSGILQISQVVDDQNFMAYAPIWLTDSSRTLVWVKGFDHTKANDEVVKTG